MVEIIDDISINTIIGAGCFVAGGLNVPGVLRIDGDVDGNINTPSNVIIGKNARIRGHIHAKSVTIGGMVQGDIVAPDFIDILSSGLVLGSLLTKKIRIEENVLLNGFCFAVNDQEEFEKVEKEYKNKQGLAASSFAHSK